MSSISPQTRPVKCANRRALELSIDSFAVQVEHGPEKGAKANLTSTSLTVGTDPACDLVLTDTTVSARHAVFRLSEQGLSVEDLSSTNGTWLAGARIHSALVPDGALLTLGESALRVRIGPRTLTVFPGTEASFHGLLGSSQAMRDLFALISQVARTDLPVLVTGETGCGKELVSRAIHEASPRRDAPLMVLDCGSIVPDLLRSELFGHEKGAFTGADQTTRGVLEEADRGTVFLDEVGEMDLPVQSNFLRALDGREITRVGSRRSIRIDVRIVAATNRDLAEMSQKGRFRSDLLYRLSGVTVTLPPLRERTEDVPLLAAKFLKEFCLRNRLPEPALPPEAVAELQEHRWPGNVRQLKHVIERLASQASGGAIERRSVRAALDPPPGSEAVPAVTRIDELERTAILQALKEARGNKFKAARLLGMSRSSLYNKLARYKLSDVEDED